jgi:Skp family chaperone for outer membrane proteins
MQLRYLPFILVLPIVCNASLSPAEAQQGAPSGKPDNPVIAIVDEQVVIGRSKAAIAIQPQFEKLKKAYENEVNKERESIQKDGQQLASQRSILSPEAFAQREQALRERGQNLNQLIATRKRTLDDTLSRGLDQIRKVMFEVVGEVATKREINIVLPKAAVILFARTLDITDDVLKRVDEKLPTVALKVVESQPEPAARQRGQQQRQQQPPRQSPPTRQPPSR